MTSKPVGKLESDSSMNSKPVVTKRFVLPRRRTTIQYGTMEMEFSEDDDDIYLDQLNPPFAKANQNQEMVRPEFKEETSQDKVTSDCPKVIQKPVPTVFPTSFRDVVLGKQKGPSPVVFVEPKPRRPATARRGEKKRKPIPVVPEKTQQSVLNEEPPAQTGTGTTVEENEASSFQEQPAEIKTPTPPEEAQKPSAVPAENTDLQPADSCSEDNMMNGKFAEKEENTAALQEENLALKLEVMHLKNLLQQKNMVLSDAHGKADQTENELSHWRTLAEEAQSSLIQMQHLKSETEAALVQSQRLFKEKEEEHFKETTSLKYSVEQLKQKLEVERSVTEKEKMLIYKGLREKTQENLELTQKIHQLETLQESLKKTEATQEEMRLQWQKKMSSFLQEIAHFKKLVQEKDLKLRTSEAERQKTLDQLHQAMDKLKEKTQENSNLTSKMMNLETALCTEKTKTRDALTETKTQQAEDKQKWDEEKSSLSQEISQLKEVIKGKDDKLNHCQEVFMTKLKQLQEQVDHIKKEKTRKKSSWGFLCCFKRSGTKD